jgi:chemotaxis protein methyltransferase CheR
MVHFAYLNLTEDIYPSILSETNAMDVILCRNVFIYLDRQAIRRSMAQYAECLLEHGVLILGASDPVEYTHTPLSWIQTGRAAYFRKGSPSGIALQVCPLPAITPNRAAPDKKIRQTFSLPTEEPVPPRPSENVSPVRAVEPDKPVTSAHKDQSTGGKPADDLDTIINLLKCSAWSDALTLINGLFRDGKENSDLWQMKAKALASLGRTDEALRSCAASLQLAHDNKHTYLIQGLILGELNRGQDAEQSLRKALYLDHSFLEAHYELGMLRVRAGDLRGGIKSLENALKRAATGDPDRELHNAGGMTYRRFAQVLQNEIGMLKEISADRKPRKLSGS